MTREELAEGLEALAYWRDRRHRLGRLRLAARRECDHMIDAWERRVRWALMRGAAPAGGVALRAATLVVRARLGLIGRRWRRRAALAAGLVGALTACAFVALDALVRAVV